LTQALLALVPPTQALRKLLLEVGGRGVACPFWLIHKRFGLLPPVSTLSVESHTNRELGVKSLNTLITTHPDAGMVSDGVKTTTWMPSPGFSGSPGGNTRSSMKTPFPS
jgi:hypothetical protein